MRKPSVVVERKDSYIVTNMNAEGEKMHRSVYLLCIMKFWSESQWSELTYLFIVSLLPKLRTRVLPRIIKLRGKESRLPTCNAYCSSDLAAQSQGAT